MWAGDQRQKLFRNLEVLEGQILLSAVTAPGANALPWDEYVCAGLRDHLHSGHLGSRVHGMEALGWGGVDRGEQPMCEQFVGGTVVPFPSPVAPEPWLSKRQIADYLGRSTRWVELRVREDLPSKMIGGRRGFRLSEVGRVPLRGLNKPTARRWALSQPQSNVRVVRTMFTDAIDDGLHPGGRTPFMLVTSTYGHPSE